MERSDLIKLVVALAIIVIAILYVEANFAPAAPSAGSGAPPLIIPAADNSTSSYPQAPELAGITGYINTPPNLTLASLRGKVVLVDFWTYSCINCLRTLPYLESDYQKYSNEGFIIIGVHSPEFEFEKNYTNVQTAVQKYGITYPVVLDSDHATWNAYQNEYWPRDYLIDSQGRIEYDHIGEGDYDVLESEIVRLLSEAKNTTVAMNATQPNATSIDFNLVYTPEIYFGDSFRRAPLGNTPFALVEGQEFNATAPASISQNIPYLGGEWVNNVDNMELASPNGSIELAYTARNVNIVAGSENGTNLTMYIDGQKITSQDSSDAPNGTATVSGERLYSVVNLPDYGQHTLRIDIEGSGFEIYTFTFG